MSDWNYTEASGLNGRWLELFPREVREKLVSGHEILGKTTCEIRIRSGQPLTMAALDRQIYWQGRQWRSWPAAGLREEGTAPLILPEEMERLWLQITQGSQYRLEREMQNGYLTLPGGHRLGFCGRAVTEEGRIKTMRDIACLNLRLARQIKGGLEPWLPLLLKEGNWCSCLLVGPPLGGKTTLLRELIRLASTGVAGADAGQAEAVAGVNVSLVDERSELAGTYQGQAQFDLGPRTDVLDACPKAEGMLLMIRSMGPQILAVDEIGKPEDLKALETALACGVRVFATIHGSGLEEICRRPGIAGLLKQGFFDRLILLERRKAGFDGTESSNVEAGRTGPAAIKILDGKTQLRLSLGGAVKGGSSGA
ncbi:MAG: stage III sporulation protein AA [Peptococcaceae bacterium]|nr:stage III sporulation protein AA [Peptococcaceae bacterium]